LIDDLTINETSFFRNTPQLELFAKVVLPEIINNKKTTSNNHRINIWSAACSTGQEVYTLAMLVSEGLKLYNHWEPYIFGTDISSTVIDIARRATYPKARLGMIPTDYLTRYFDDLGDKIRIKDSLRRITSFQVHNLCDSMIPGIFDVIFCRNVMIYFSKEEQERLVRKFTTRLQPGGFLFIGHSESLQGMNVEFTCRVQEGGVVYQRV
jgi:chemotaxis protein methyltransferase CheR